LKVNCFSSDVVRLRCCSNKFERWSAWIFLVAIKCSLTNCAFQSFSSCCFGWFKCEDEIFIRSFVIVDVFVLLSILLYIFLFYWCVVEAGECVKNNACGGIVLEICNACFVYNFFFFARISFAMLVCLRFFLFQLYKRERR
jgi:hypothetical protein